MFILCNNTLTGIHFQPLQRRGKQLSRWNSGVC